MGRNEKKRFPLLLLLTFPLLLALLQINAPEVQAGPPVAKYVILMIADGWGPKQIEATNEYTGNTPAYQLWTQYWMSTYPAGGSYDPGQAWANFDYVKSSPTDSAAAATALYTGVKTSNGRIGVSASGERLFSIGEKARVLDKATGAVSSVYISHATPGAWYAHNDSRLNGYAIADEGLFGDPNTTGSPVDPWYGGGRGPTSPTIDVLIGSGHPNWKGSNYVNSAIRDKLADTNDPDHDYTFVERIAGSSDGGPRLLSAANVLTVTKLAGLFGGTNGNLDWRLADGSGYDPESPTLVEMTNAALIVLNRNSKGFVLLVEGGAVDWAGHSNQMDRMMGELIDFNNAVQTVVDWIENPTNGSSWNNTLLVVTGDHETGYLTAGPGVLASQPLGEVSASTLAKEKLLASSERRASWDDLDGDDEIDANETVYWAWNIGAHTNSLIPLYAKGVGAELFASYATGSDPVRGAYIDNTDVFKVLDTVLRVNQAPIAGFTTNHTLGEVPLTVNFDASPSGDSDGTIVSYAWEFGDGSSNVGITSSYTYTLTGTYTVTLTVTDNCSATNTGTATIRVVTTLEEVYLPVIVRK